MKKLTFEYVSNYFKEQDCELLETTYVNANTKMYYKCSCGNISSIAFSSFKNGTRCMKCGRTKMKDKQKLSYEFVNQEFKKVGYELLDKDYINSMTKLKYKCNICNSINYISYDCLSSGIRCVTCKNIKSGSSQRLSFDYVQNYFKQQNCELLENFYKNSETLMKYRCSCGTISYIRWNEFKNGSRCGCIKSQGEVKIREILNKYSVNYIAEKSFKNCIYKAKLKFDFYLPQLHTCIEYDGEQHYKVIYLSKDKEKNKREFEAQQVRDSIKTAYCQQNNITLIRIPYWEFSNIETILSSSLFLS